MDIVGGSISLCISYCWGSIVYVIMGEQSPSMNRKRKRGEACLETLYSFGAVLLLCGLIGTVHLTQNLSQSKSSVRQQHFEG